jgi:hypothetical protein
MRAVCTQTYLPLRANPSDTSEMVSQLLFGETCNILHEADRWVKVRCDYDGYEGWVFRPSLTIISDSEFEGLMHAPRTILSNPILKVTEDVSDKTMYITAGSVLYNLNNKRSTFSLLNHTYSFTEQALLSNMAQPASEVIEMSFRFINTPYLWGGRSTFGIDCSGLVQTCFKVAGIVLPRDASQQAERGKLVSSVESVRPADLAFFQNPQGKIVHVGILLSSTEIIHASNYVQLNAFDKNGIWHPHDKIYTHRLAFIKRIIT